MSKQFFTKKDKRVLINAIKRANPNNEEESFDLGKLLRDYGFKIIVNVIREDEE